MGEVVQIRDYQSRRDFAKASQEALEQMAIAMIVEWHTLAAGIDALDTAPSEMNPEAS